MSDLPVAMQKVLGGGLETLLWQDFPNFLSLVWKRIPIMLAHFAGAFAESVPALGS